MGVGVETKQSALLEQPILQAPGTGREKHAPPEQELTIPQMGGVGVGVDVGAEVGTEHVHQMTPVVMSKFTTQAGSLCTVQLGVQLVELHVLAALTVLTSSFF